MASYYFDLFTSTAKNGAMIYLLCFGAQMLFMRVAEYASWRAVAWSLSIVGVAAVIATHLLVDTSYATAWVSPAGGMSGLMLAYLFHRLTIELTRKHAIEVLRDAGMLKQPEEAAPATAEAHTDDDASAASS